MIIVYLIIGLLCLYVLFQLHNFWRLPIYNRVFNMWQEDVEKSNKANFVIIMMCLISFVMGILCTLMIN
jgi:hypothetical protein